ncbi:MAG: site-specific integrase [Anaerolineales bacterium]|nr:site-specific integrase [Anaerolineales bacterium]MDW8447555.1 site-specific integrase [Anaerolineales bacterium]
MDSENLSAHLSSESTLPPAIQGWKIYLADQGNSIHTIKAFVHDLEILAQFLSPTRTLGSITTADLNHFLNWLQKGRGVPCSPKTLSRRVTSLKSFFRWLHQHAVLPHNPAEKVIQRSVISPLPIVLSPSEVERVMEICREHRRAKKPDARYFTLFYLLISTGIKKTECLGINLNHLELQHSPPFLFVRYSNPQYRYKERKIPLPLDWVEGFEEYRAQYQIQDRLFPWSQRRLEYLLEDLSEQAGLEKHISFDMCRWTCALLDLQSGMEKNAIRQKLGLSKVQWREVGMKLDQLAASILAG